MKIQLHHILILTCVSLIVSISSAYAQDAGIPEPEIVDSERDKSDREKILYSPGEADSRYLPKTSSPAKDSATVIVAPAVPKFKAEKPAPATKGTVEKQSADKQSKDEEDDSILSFNFLYYIIEKYKLQDIVD